MNKKTVGRNSRWMAVAAVALTIPGIGLAEVYQWRDASGNMQFSDKPPAVDSQAKGVSIKKVKPISAESPAAQKELFEKTQAQAQGSKDRAEKDSKEASDQAAAAQREKDCKLAREAVAQYQTGQRMSVLGENGEKRYLDDKEIGSRMQEAAKQAEAACAPKAEETPKPKK